MSRPIGRNKPDPQVREDGLVRRVLQPRAAGAIEVKDDLAYRIAVLGETQRPSVS